MLKAMRKHYRAKDLDAAAAIAKDAAPYMHPRLANSKLEMNQNVRQLVIEEIVVAPGDVSHPPPADEMDAV